MAPGSVALSAVVSDGNLRIRVRDAGRGMIPRSDSPGLGLGVGLMGRLADALEISSLGLGTEICFTFQL